MAHRSLRTYDWETIICSTCGTPGRVRGRPRPARLGMDRLYQYGGQDFRIRAIVPRSRATAVVCRWFFVVDSYTYYYTSSGGRVIET
jgi:hypothetical protein